MTYYRFKKRCTGFLLHSVKSILILGLVAMGSAFGWKAQFCTITTAKKVNTSSASSVSQKTKDSFEECFLPLPIFDQREFVKPAVGVLTSPYGERWGKTHYGIDIGGQEGSKILAAKAGTVLSAQWVDGYGNYILLQHDSEFTTAYAHCQSIAVSAGDYVMQGECIGYMGSTGNSTGTASSF